MRPWTRDTLHDLENSWLRGETGKCSDNYNSREVVVGWMNTALERPDGSPHAGLKSSEKGPEAMFGCTALVLCPHISMHLTITLMPVKGRTTILSPRSWCKWSVNHTCCNYASWAGWDSLGLDLSLWISGLAQTLAVPSSFFPSLPTTPHPQRSIQSPFASITTTIIITNLPEERGMLQAEETKCGKS